MLIVIYYDMIRSCLTCTQSATISQLHLLHDIKAKN